MSQCVKCGARFIGTPENPPKPGLCRYCELDQLRSELATEKANVKKLREILAWTRIGSTCLDPATSATSRKHCPVCQALKETEKKMSDDYDPLEDRLWRALAMIAIALAIITCIASLAQIILWLAR